MWVGNPHLDDASTPPYVVYRFDSERDSGSYSLAPRRSFVVALAASVGVVVYETEGRIASCCRSVNPHSRQFLGNFTG